MTARGDTLRLPETIRHLRAALQHMLSAVMLSMELQSLRSIMTSGHWHWAMVEASISATQTAFIIHRSIGRAAVSRVRT